MSCQDDNVPLLLSPSFLLQPTHLMIVRVESDEADSSRPISKVSTLQGDHDEKGALTQEVEPLPLTYPDGGFRAWLNIVGVCRGNFY